MSQINLMRDPLNSSVSMFMSAQPQILSIGIETSLEQFWHNFTSNGMCLDLNQLPFIGMSAKTSL